MPPNADPKLTRRMFALLGQARVTGRGERIWLYRWMVSDPRIVSTNELDENEIRMIADTLAYWQRNNELESRSRTAIDEAKAKWRD
jgi:hypothetical protein